MNWWPSGLITILIYGSYAQGAEEMFAINTENNMDLLTEDGKILLTEASN